MASAVGKKLLVLDVKGFLVDAYYSGDSHQLPSREHDGKVNRFLVYKRPLCDEFIRFCFENFVVGVWSAANERNVRAFVDYIFEDNKDKLDFVWNQGHCTDTGIKHPDNEQKPIFLKELWKLWQEKTDFDPSNTILIDDSPYKALNNPPHTAVFPKPYNAFDDADNYLGELRTYLEGVLESQSVQDYVKDHPTGELCVSDCDVKWSGICEFVISKNKRNGLVPDEWLGISSIKSLEQELDDGEEKDKSMIRQVQAIEKSKHGPQKEKEEDVREGAIAENGGGQDCEGEDNELQDEQDTGCMGHEEMDEDEVGCHALVKDDFLAPMDGGDNIDAFNLQESARVTRSGLAKKRKHDSSGGKSQSTDNHDSCGGLKLHVEPDKMVSVTGNDRLNKGDQLAMSNTHKLTSESNAGDISAVLAFDDPHPSLPKAGDGFL